MLRIHPPQGFRSTSASAGRMSPFRQTLASPAVLFVSALLAQVAHATPLYFYDAQVTGITPNDFTDTSSSPVSASVSGTNDVGATYSFSVLAGPGMLGDQNGASLSSGSNIGVDVRSNTNFLEDNIVITGPSGATTVNYSLNFTLTGKFALSATGNGIASANVSLSDQRGGTLGVLAASSFSSPSFNYVTGLFAGITPGPNISVNLAGTIPEGTALNGSAVSVFLNMATDDGGLTSGLAPLGPGGGSLNANIDFLDPLSFPTDGPVFDFLDPTTGDPVTGWTANSTDGCIVDNQFRCGQTTAVDEPPTLPLFGAAIIGTLLWMRRRRWFEFCGAT